MAKEETFTIAPAPWTCKCTAYVLVFFHASSRPLPHDIVYDSLEGRSEDFSDARSAGAFKGGMGMVQIVRYTETPVGPYDEIVLSPGNFETPGRKEKGLRLTRLYVSQKQTCYNGRRNWNIPKHLARFEFTPSKPSSDVHPPPPLTVSIYPYDPKETTPFFTASLVPPSILSSLTFPFKSSWAQTLGQPASIVIPPLPSGDSSHPEEPGTDKWMSTKGAMATKKAKLIWWDMKQGAARDGQARDTGQVVKGRENWWPGMGRWRLGLWLQDAILEFAEPERW